MVALRRLPNRRLRAATYRHIATPLVQRMDAELELSVVGGFRMFAHQSSLTGRALATAGLWEWWVAAALRELLSPGDVFVDVGANAGYDTILAARQVGASGHVYALEPAPETFALLERNLELNGIANVTALRVAAGAEEGRATLFGTAYGHDELSSLRRRREPGVFLLPRLETHDRDDEAIVATEVEVRALHTILAEDLERVALVKIDVEGFEAEALRGLEPAFESGLRPSVIVEIHASLAPDAPAFVTEYCLKYELGVRWVVDDEGLEYRLAPQDRRLEIRDLASPDDIVGIKRDRFCLILESNRKPRRSSR